MDRQSSRYTCPRVTVHAWAAVVALFGIEASNLVVISEVRAAAARATAVVLFFLKASAVPIV